MDDIWCGHVRKSGSRAPEGKPKAVLAGWLAALAAGKLARGRKSGWLAAQEAVKRVAATARERVKAAKMGVKKTRKFARKIHCVLSEYCDGGGGGC